MAKSRLNIFQLENGRYLVEFDDGTFESIGKTLFEKLFEGQTVGVWIVEKPVSVINPTIGSILVHPDGTIQTEAQLFEMLDTAIEYLECIGVDEEERKEHIRQYFIKQRID